MADTSTSFKNAAGATVLHDARDGAGGGEIRPTMTVGDDSTRIAGVTDPASITGAAVGGSQGSALNVNPNAIQKATYLVSVANIASAVLTANTARAIFSFEHAGTATKTVRVRRIAIGGLQTTALAGSQIVQVSRGTAASTAGTVVTAQPTLPGAAAAEVVAKSLPTITAATLMVSRVAAITPATANTGFADFLVYDWQESGETIPLTLRAANLDTLVVSIMSSAAQNITLSCSVILTEE
jgi:hypothetical protein